MRNKLRIILLAICACLFSLSMVMVGCNSTGGTEATYYLSLESASWPTYDSADDVPSEILFTKSGDLWVLQTELAEGEQFTVNAVNSSVALGYDALFTAETKLVEGDDGSLKVAEAGTYVLQLDAETSTLMYAFTATEEETEVTVESVVITSSETELLTDSIYVFSAIVTYSDGSTGTSVSWSSSDPEIASVDENGIVSALAVGSATITATAEDVSASVTVTVSQTTVAVTGVTLDRDALSLELNESETLTATVSPANASNTAVLWESSDSDVVTVSDGTVTAVGYGTATVTVTTLNGGYSAACTVTVVRHAESISLSSSDLTLVANGNAKTITVTIGPDGVSDTSFTWEITSGSGNISVTEEDGALMVSGLQVGTATIVVTSADNSSLSATCSITIVDSGSVLVDLQESMQITINETGTLTVTLENDDINEVDWEISSTNVATLTSDGATATVTGVNFGTATVTATVTSASGGSYLAECTLLVAEEYYFIYGVGVIDGVDDWTYTEYLTDKDAAAAAGILLTEESTGIYSLTRHLTASMGFQIIFPNVASFTDASGNWNKDIKPSSYYDSTRSDTAYIANTTDQFKVNAAGVYKITLDLTGDSAKVYITLVSLDVTSVQLSVAGDKTVLSGEGDSVQISITVTPTDATYTESDLSVWLTSDAENIGDYVTVSYDFSSMTITVTVVAEPDSDLTFTVHCSLTDVTTTTSLTVLASDSEEVPVSSISFDETAYYIDVNNGGSAWTTTVSASVNEDATSQGVTYSTSDSGITVDASTGVVTATAFGTFTITATASGDSSVTTTVTVTVYSSGFYLNGVVYNALTWSNTALSQSATTLEGTAFENYGFTDSGDHQTFTLIAAFNSGDLFQIIFLGMDSSWTNALTSSYFNSSASDNSSVSSSNFMISVTGMYIITIDLSGTTPVVRINYYGEILSSVTLSSTASSSVYIDDSFEISFTLSPSSITVSDDEISWEVSGDGVQYLTVTDNGTSLSITVTGAPESGSASVTIVCTIRGVSGTFSFAVMAEDEEEIAVSSIAFEESAYYINVNNGGSAWTTTVSALVNEDATVQGVTYSTSDSGITVDPTTGVVTASKLGTFTITATAAGDSNFTVTVTVTVYSDTFYIIGDVSGGWTAISSDVTSTSGTAYESYTFTMESETLFTLTVYITEWTTFQIAFCGMDDGWSAVVDANYVDTANSDNAETYLEYNTNIQMNTTGTYTITVDLSGTSPVVTIKSA